MKRISLLLITLACFIGTQSIKASINVDSLKEALTDEIVRNSKEIYEQQKDSMILSKLSADQLMVIKNAEIDAQRLEIESRGKRQMPFNGFQIFLICALPFIFAGTVIVWNVKTKNIESKRRYDLYNRSLEMGQAIPDHFFDEPKKQQNPTSNLKKGILWLAVGLAISWFFVIVHEKDALILGIVPAFLGIGYLLVHFLEKPKPLSNDEQHG